MRSAEDGTTKNKFLASIEKYSPDKVNCVKIIAAFIDSLLSADHSVMESFENEISDREDELIEGAVLTSIFFPLTIIVGWYGMNFESMPEFRWRFGYAYVIALSIVVVVILAIIGKKKKWF